MVEIAYAAPMVRSNWMLRNAYRLAWWWAFVPLALATVIFFGWLASGWEILMISGFLLLYGGAFAVLLATVMLPLAVMYGRRGEGKTWGAACRRVWPAAALVGADLLAAPVYAGVAIYLLTTCVVIVENKSGALVELFVIERAGVREELGPIADGRMQRARVDSDEPIHYEMRQGGVVTRGELVGYGGAGGGSRVQTTVRAEAGVETVVVRP